MEIKMKLIKSTSLAVTMCMLLNSQVFADTLSSEEMVDSSSEQVLVVKHSAVQKSPGQAAAREVTIPHSFTANTPAIADEVNENFTAVKSTVDANSVDVSQLQSDVSVLQANVDALQPSTVGPQLDLSQTRLEQQGWEVCFSETFEKAGVSTISSILALCTGANLMLACRPVDSDIFVLSAQAPRDDVIFDTGTDVTTTHTANGTEWYFNEDRSWGFAPEGASVRKSTCDNLNADEYRMCIHTRSGELRNGYKCGTKLLNGDATWERVILQHN